MSVLTRSIPEWLLAEWWLHSIPDNDTVTVEMRNVVANNFRFLSSFDTLIRSNLLTDDPDNETTDQHFYITKAYTDLQALPTPHHTSCVLEKLSTIMGDPWAASYLWWLILKAIINKLAYCILVLLVVLFLLWLSCCCCDIGDHTVWWESIFWQRWLVSVNDSICPSGWLEY